MSDFVKFSAKPTLCILFRPKLAIFTLILSVFFPFFYNNSAVASITGGTTVNQQFTSTKTPTITGTIRSWCDDVVIGVGTDEAQYWNFFYSDYGEVSVQDNGYDDTTWSLNLASNNYGLVNGVYSVYVSSACGYPTYEDPFYADLHYSAITIVPQHCDAYCVPVYRFYNIINGAHFYTTTEHEKRDVLNMPQYRFEGITNYAKNYRTALPGMSPVYRFYNFKQGVHFYTSNQAEATNINNTQYNTYRYEGVSYYAYPYSAPSTVPVHRFYKFKQGVHFYTSNQAEATNINNTQYNTYRYEGVSYYSLANTN